MGAEAPGLILQKLSGFPQKLLQLIEMNPVSCFRHSLCDLAERLFVPQDQHGIYFCRAAQGN